MLVVFLILLVVLGLRSYSHTFPTDTRTSACGKPDLLGQRLLAHVGQSAPGDDPATRRTDRRCRLERGRLSRRLAALQHRQQDDSALQRQLELGFVQVLCHGIGHPSGRLLIMTDVTRFRATSGSVWLGTARSR